MSNEAQVTTPVVAETKAIEEVGKIDTKNDLKAELDAPQEPANNEKPNEDKKDAEAESKDNKADTTTAAPAPPPRPRVHKVDFEKDVVYLYQFCRTSVIPSPSPFCLKVETWLRACGIKYENIDHKMKFRSNKGQLPFVELNGEEIADSAVIIREVGRHFEHDLDAQLTAEQKNVSHATIAMLENHFHWIDVYWRTKNPDATLQGYKIDLQHMMGTRMPAGLLKLFYRLTFRRRGLKKVRATGIGVHTPEEVTEMGQDDLKVLRDMLDDKPFFFGQDPTNLDIVVFATLAQLIVVDKEVAYPLRDWLLENCANLLDHFNRMKERYYPDWEEMCRTLDMNTHLPKPLPEEKEEEEKEKDTEKPAEEEKEKEKQVEDEKEKEKDATTEKKVEDENKKENEDK